MLLLNVCVAACRVCRHSWFFGPGPVTVPLLYPPPLVRTHSHSHLISIPHHHPFLSPLTSYHIPLAIHHPCHPHPAELDDLLVGEGKAPSVLNGGLTNEWVILAGVLTLAIGGFLEFKSFEMSQKAGYKPGDYGFDPLGLHALRASFGLDRVDVQLTREEKLASGKADMELCEIKNGRLAMLAITGYAGQEFLLGSPVVQQTPFFFGDPIM